MILHCHRVSFAKAGFTLHDFRRLRRPQPNRGDSLIRLVTELKYLEDSSNDSGATLHGVAGAKTMTQSLSAPLPHSTQNFVCTNLHAATSEIQTEQVFGKDCVLKQVVSSSRLFFLKIVIFEL